MHGEVFDDPLFDLFQTIVFSVEDFLGPTQVLFHAGFCAPRNIQHPVEVVAHDRSLCGHRRHVLELLNLGVGLFLGLFRQLRRSDLFFEFGDFVRAVLAIAQLALDRLHLFIQIILALCPLHLGLHAGFDLFLDLQHRHFALHQAIDLFQTFADRQRF